MTRPSLAAVLFLSVLLLGPGGATGAASAPPVAPAHVTFEEGARLLNDLYINRSPVDVGLQVTAFRSRLAVVCRDRPVDCPVDDGIEALRGLYGSIGDTHLFVLGREAFERGLAQATSSPPVRDTFGLVFGASDGTAAVVMDVLPGSAAAQAGVHAGDIVQVIGESFAVHDLDVEAEVTLRVRRGKGEREVRLVRTRVPSQRQPQLYTAPGGRGDVAVLRIPTFVTTSVHSTGLAVHGLIHSARNQGVRALVIDLRAGAGGSGAECVSATGAFTGPFAFQAHTRRGVFEAGWDGTQSRLWERAFVDVSPPVLPDPVPLQAAQVGRWTGRAVVLVNRRTGSCHELMAFMLQRSGIPVVGEPTAGYLDTGSLLMPLAGGGAVGVAVVRHVTADGQPFPIKVTPDVPVTEDPALLLATGEDRLLEAALSVVAAED